MLRLPVAVAAAAASLFAGALAAAPTATRRALPDFCRDWGGDRVVALACDSGREARDIDLRVGGRRARPTRELGIGQFDGAEPLQAGETVTLRWKHPSSHAILAVWATAPRGTRMVVLDLRARPTSVEVAAQPGGALRVTTPSGTSEHRRPARAGARRVAAAQRVGRGDRAARRCRPPRARPRHPHPVRGAGPRRLRVLRRCSSAIPRSTRARAGWPSRSSATRTCRRRRRRPIAARRWPCTPAARC